MQRAKGANTGSCANEAMGMGKKRGSQEDAAGGI